MEDKKPFFKKIFPLTKKKIFISSILIILIIAVSYFSYNWYLQNRRQQEVATYKADAKTIFNALTAVEKVAKNTEVPSTTTMTSDQWDAFYTNAQNEVSSACAPAQNTNLTVSDMNDTVITAFNGFQNAVEGYCSDLSKQYTLTKSADEMEVQVNKDKSIVSIDQNALTDQEGIYNSAPGFTSSYVDSARSTLTEAQSQLDADTKTNNDQVTQIDTITNKTNTEAAQDIVTYFLIINYNSYF